MIALLQRVTSARVEIQGTFHAEIGPGLLMLVCAEPEDTEMLAEKMLAKVLKLRIFADNKGKMNRSLVDVNGGLLIVSQFTLAADVTGGNRPSFIGAAPPELGRALYEHIVALARARHTEFACGEFGADMRIHLVNNGPVTIPVTIRA